MPFPVEPTPVGAKSLLQSCVEALLQVPYWKFPKSELQGLPDVGANYILERILEERPHFYAGILDCFSQAVTQIHFKSAVPPFQMLRILLALLEYRYIFKLTIASLRQNCSILGFFPDYGICLIALHLPNCNPGQQSLAFLQSMTSLEELDLSGSDLGKQPLLSHVLHLTCLSSLNLSCVTLHEQDAEDIHSLEKLVSLEHLNVAETRARKAKNSFGWQVPIEYVNSSVIGAISNLTRLTYLDVSASYGTYIPLLTDLQVLVVDNCTLVAPAESSLNLRLLTKLSLRNTIVQPEARASLQAVVQASSASLREMVLVSTKSCINVWEGLLSHAANLVSLTVGGTTDWKRLSTALLKLTSLQHLEILMSPEWSPPPASFFFLPHLLSLSYTNDEVCAISKTSPPEDWKPPRLRQLDLKTPGFFGNPGQRLVEWVQGLTYLAFDWDDRKHALVSHYYATGNAQSQDGFPMDPSLQLAGHPMADMMENIPRLKQLKRLDIRYSARALKLANIVGLPDLREIHVYCTGKVDEAFLVKEQREVFKMATGNLVPGNPQLALVTYNEIVVWPKQSPRAGPILFTQIRSQYAGSEGSQSPDDLAYGREELLQLRPALSPSIDIGIAGLSIL